MEMICVPTGELDVNSYILRNENSKEAVVIDPGEAEPVLEALMANNLSASDIILTHGHFDHIGGVGRIKRETGAKVWIHELDADMLHDDIKNYACFVGMNIEPVHADHLFREDGEVNIGGIEFKVLCTPGHTPGGVSFVIESEKSVFSGDTLFRLGVGRTDFPGSDEDVLMDSILNKLFTLPENFDVYPGHMRPTSIGFEMLRNPVVRMRKEQ